MNNTTKEIANRFDVDMQEARAIQLVLECCVGVDYSEMSKRELNALFNEAKDMYDNGENCGCDN